jgi:hypothetical protein
MAIAPGLINVTEGDGSPNAWVKKITVTNGSLTISGADATIAFGSTLHGLALELPDAADDGKYIMYDHGSTSYIMDTPAGGGDMTIAVWDGDADGFIDADAGGTDADSSAATGLAYVTAGTWTFSNTVPANIAIGADDTTPGVLSAYGGSSAEAGGSVILHMEADQDAIVADSWTIGIAAATDDLIIGLTGVDVDALKLDAAKDMYLTDGDAYIQEGGVTHIAFDAANERIMVGVDDTLTGDIYIYGHTAASTEGGELYLYLAASHDDSIDYYTVQAHEDDFLIGPDTDPDLLKIAAGSGLEVTAGNLVVSVGDIALTDATPDITLTDSTAGDGTGNLLFASATAAADIVATLQVDVANAATTFVTLDGTNEEVLFGKKIDIASLGIENVGAIADDGAITLISSGGTVTVESVVFTGGAVTGVTSLAMSAALSTGADPADQATGINLSNAESIAWEASAAGTDVIALTVNATEDVILGSGTTATTTQIIAIGDVQIQPDNDTSNYFRFSSDATDLTLASVGNANITIDALDSAATGTVTIDNSTPSQGHICKLHLNSSC